MTGRTKSILLQVAFKEAAKQVGDDLDKLETMTSDYYMILLGLLDKLGIDPEDFGDATPQQQTQQKRAGRRQQDAPTVTIGGETWFDYRGLKELGLVDANHPDFKSSDGKRSEWIATKDGRTKDSAFVKTLAGAGLL